MHALAQKCRSFGALILGTLVALPVAVGCTSPTEPPPKTYLVTGKVVYKDGTPFPGRTIEFRSQADPTRTMISEIGQDGSFTLFTIFQNEKLPGAIPGPCQVTVHRHITDMKDAAPYQLSQLFTVEEKENYFTIEIEAPLGLP